MSTPVYLVGPADCALRAAVFSVPVGAFDTVDAFGEPDARAPGIVLVDGAVGAAEVLSLLRRLAASEGGWTLAVTEADEPGHARTLSLGLPATLGEVDAKARGEEGTAGVLLELHGVLEQIATARHDINNPLTSALAEVQMALMDVTHGEARESLEITSTQLRRIQQMVQATNHLRPTPRR